MVGVKFTELTRGGDIKILSSIGCGKKTYRPEAVFFIHRSILVLPGKFSILTRGANKKNY